VIVLLYSLEGFFATLQILGIAGCLTAAPQPSGCVPAQSREYFVRLISWVSLVAGPVPISHSAWPRLPASPTVCN
jgi:hypothetical protein